MSTNSTTGYRTQRPGKTREDRMPVDERPRVIAWKKRQEELRAQKQEK